MLVELGADLEAYDDEGWTPLHAAVHWQQKESIRILAEAGADLEAVTFRGDTCMQLTDNKALHELVEGRVFSSFFFFSWISRLTRFFLSRPHQGTKEESPERQTGIPILLQKGALAFSPCFFLLCFCLTSLCLRIHRLI